MENFQDFIKEVKSYGFKVSKENPDKGFFTA